MPQINWGVTCIECNCVSSSVASLPNPSKLSIYKTIAIPRATATKLCVHTSPISLAPLMQPLLRDEELRGHSRSPARVETEPSILSASPYLPLNVVLSCLLDQPYSLQHIRYVVNAPLLHVQLLCRLSSPWPLTSL